ncbi:GerAB/ArcD/ProY family transporter [Clostridium sp. 'White wine YQ']|uniref:GerAB/ArcD/ProY family transporter n=1 Tax=Clostridium sp. 'White wine YQ' TaxID=3027474 RepID=UPI0023668E13|nr:GerAB/ArcD/ProY family transporter [Clostridium sp. 'White wine YQ']MDD7795882.1 GerAB/ArcD/ProY family transporter [Clostridium sp. 'White wine YQ']
MKRYFFYLVFINSINNIIIFLPRVILHDQYHGSIMAIIFSIPFGTILLYLFMKSIINFPNKAFPEILSITLPRWAQISIMLFICSLWYISGFFMLLALIQMVQRFIFFKMSEYILLAVLVLVLLWAIRTDGLTIFHSLEIFLVIIVPMILFIFAKAIFNHYFSWDSCLEVVTHTFSIPTLTSYAVTTYMFTGYTDMLIFNKFFNKENFQLKHIWIFPLVELFLLTFAFFIPIGFLGTQQASSFNYPWLAATDCISIKIGVIERTLFIYILLFFFTAIINIIIHWYVSFELINDMFKFQIKPNKIQRIHWYILSAFGIIPFLLIGVFKNEEALFSSGTVWLILRLFAELIVVGLVILTAYRAKKKGAT